MTLRFRVFISSTFVDFARERDEIALVVVPELRRRLAPYGADLTVIDLRWGITAAEAEQGQVVGRCLREIERCRPFFVGLLGARTGWVPPKEVMPGAALADRPWLVPHVGAASMTELEFVHGLCAPDAEGEAPGKLVYVRRDALLGPRIRSALDATGVATGPVFDSPEELGHRMVADLWRLFESRLPARSDAAPPQLEAMRHEACGQGLRSVVDVVPGDTASLTAAIVARAEVGGMVAVLGPRGSGCSVRLAHAAARLPDRFVRIAHHAEVDPQGGDVDAVIARVTAALFSWRGIDGQEAEGPELRRAHLGERLAHAGATARERGEVLCLLLDGAVLEPDWLPQPIPPGIVVAWIPAANEPAAVAGRSDRTAWTAPPWAPAAAAAMVHAELAEAGRTLEDSLLQQLVSHPAAASPGFLARVLDELRVHGDHERLPMFLQQCLEAPSAEDAARRRLRRVVEDLGRDATCRLLRVVAASRCGASDATVVAAAGGTAGPWARLRLLLGNLLVERQGLVELAPELAAVLAASGWWDEAALDVERGRLVDHWLGQPAGLERSVELTWLHARRGALGALRESLLSLDVAGPLLRAGAFTSLGNSWHQADPAMDAGQIERIHADAWRRWLQDAPDLDPAVLGRLADFLQQWVGVVGEAGVIWAHVVEARRRDGEHEPLALALNNLGNIRLLEGCSADAEALFREALAIRAKVLPEGHPHALGTMDNLAQAVAAGGDAKGAVPIYEQALALRLRHLGRDHADTATTCNNLGMTLQGLGEMERAGQLLADALASTRIALGDDHPDTGISFGNLGMHQVLEGRFEEGVVLMEQAIAIHARTLGPTHPTTLTSRSRRSEVRLLAAVGLRERGALHAAIAEFEAVIAEAGAADPPDLLRVATASSGLGETHARRGDRASALAALERALDIRRALLGEGDPLTQRVVARIDAVRQVS